MNYKRWTDLLIEKYRDCPGCNLKARSRFIFCKKCQEDWLRRLLREKGNRKNLGQTDFLWLQTWTGGHPLTGILVKSLKGGGDDASFSMLAQLFISHRVGPLPARATLVYPSKGYGDHGLQWALALSDLIGYPICPLLLSSKNKQALLRRESRGNVKFIPKTIKGPIIFVDDVVTTGATAKGAQTALGNPKEFAVWSIFHRPLL